MLPRSLENPRLVVLAAIALFVLAAAGLPFLGGEFLPNFEEPDFIVHMVGLPGTSLSSAVEAGVKVEKRLLAIPGVLSVSQRAGRAELADEVSGPESSEFDVALSPKVREVKGGIERVCPPLPDFPCLSLAVRQFF